ncbi:MAG: hypothetical protein OK474_12030 [Thaumarchaeota archaeon]|nr:hypothetical protein [Nitrososphaerota archaeon]
MPASDPVLLLVLILYGMIALGMGYLLFILYRRKTRKVRKLR